MGNLRLIQKKALISLKNKKISFHIEWFFFWEELRPKNWRKRWKRPLIVVDAKKNTWSVKMWRPYYGNFNRFAKFHFKPLFLVKKEAVVGRFHKKQILKNIWIEGKIIDTSSKWNISRSIINKQINSTKTLWLKKQIDAYY